ncbi:MAG: fasciclin domain-containing protein [Anaerolineae bacterium]|nr:fasciclin domain-containing protein [Anaerolineae bacterium]
MNKRISLVLLAMWSLLSIIPALAQEAAQPTIADLLAASASGDQPQFTLLLAAVEAADPSVMEMLANAELERKITVFAPTDAAFIQLSEDLGEETFAAVLADPELLTQILLYHVIEGTSRSTDLIPALQSMGQTISGPTLNGQYIDVAVDDDGDLTVDSARVILPDLEASNGLIHGIDAVLLPETRTIAEIVIDAAADPDAPQFTTLLSAVQAADPAVLGALSDSTLALTVFAPTDQAFAALSSTTLSTILADPALVTSTLLYHVLPSKLYTYSLMSDMDLSMAATSADGLKVDSLLEGAQLTLTLEMKLAGGIDVRVNGATAIARDVDATNGVIHIIDAVLLPG